jgi:hypothetical protein
MSAEERRAHNRENRMRKKARRNAQHAGNVVVRRGYIDVASVMDTAPDWQTLRTRHRKTVYAATIDARVQIAGYTTPTSPLRVLVDARVPMDGVAGYEIVLTAEGMPRLHVYPRPWDGSPGHRLTLLAAAHAGAVLAPPDAGPVLPPPDVLLTTIDLIMPIEYGE